MAMYFLSCIETQQVYCILQGAFLSVKEKSISLHDEMTTNMLMNDQMPIYLKVEQQGTVIIFLKHVIWMLQGQIFNKNVVICQLYVVQYTIQQI